MFSFRQKGIGLLIGLSLLVFLAYKLLDSPEKYLKRKTQKIISLVSEKHTEINLHLISKVSQIAKYIHFDVHLTAEYEGQVYTAKSLNEFRSLMMSYFRLNSKGTTDYKNLAVQVKKNKQEGLVTLDGLFEKQGRKTHCKVLLVWIKEKKWYIKKIEVSECLESGS